MITPDDKNWTWVLEQQCLECGFDTTRCGAEQVAGLIRSNAEDWMQLYIAGFVRAGRPNDSTWSTLEYACHVRDVYLKFYGRFELMLNEDRPTFENWDQDATAELEQYEDQDATDVVDALCLAATAVAQQLDGVNGATWDRVGVRSDGSAFTVATLARYLIHDPVHHVWDVEQQIARD